MPNNRKKKNNNNNNHKKNKNRNKNNNKNQNSNPNQQNQKQIATKKDEVTIPDTAAVVPEAATVITPPPEKRNGDVEQCITSTAMSNSPTAKVTVSPTILEVSTSSSSIEAIDDNQPVIVEAESSEADDTIEEQCEIHDVIEDAVGEVDEVCEKVEVDESASQKAQDVKAKRIQNRIELESHFFPQMQNPRFLDPISEENSDSSDVERKPEKPQTPQSPKPNMKHANVAFPKPNQELCKKRKHLRQEETIPLIVETKILHEMPVEEQCGFWDTEITPTLENAEIMYISGSSSASDIASCCSDSESIDSADVRIETPIIDLNANSKMLASGGNIFSNTDNKNTIISGENLDDILLESSVCSAKTNTETMDSGSCNDDHHQQTKLLDEKNLLIREDVAPNTNENSCGSMENENASNVRKILKLSELSRERSFESTYSEDSQTSQCTAIHTGIRSPPICDFADFTKIKQLKVLCIEKLMSMPYGHLVMENLALTSENLEYLLQQQENHSRHLEHLIEQGKSQFEQYMREKSNSPPPVPPPPTSSSLPEEKEKQPRLLNIMLEEKDDRPTLPPTPQERVQKLDSFCSQIKPVIPAFFKHFESKILKNSENVSRSHAIIESERQNTQNMMSFENLTTKTSRSSDTQPKAHEYAEDKQNMNENTTADRTTTTKEFLNNEIFKDFDNLSKMLNNDTNFPVKEEISVVREFPRNPKEEIAKARAEFLSFNKPENRNSFHSSSLHCVERPAENKRHTVHESSSQSYSSKEHFIPIRKAEPVSNLTSFPVTSHSVEGFSSESVKKEHIVNIQKESVAPAVPKRKEQESIAPEVPKRKEQENGHSLAFSSFFKNDKIPELPPKDYFGAEKVEKSVHFKEDKNNNNTKEHIVTIQKESATPAEPLISKFSSFLKNEEDKSSKLMKEVTLEDETPAKPSFFGQTTKPSSVPEPPKRSQKEVSPPEIPLPPIPIAPKRENLYQEFSQTQSVTESREHIIPISPEITSPPVAPRRENLYQDFSQSQSVTESREHIIPISPEITSPQVAPRREHIIPVATSTENVQPPVAPRREHIVPIVTSEAIARKELVPEAPKRDIYIAEDTQPPEIPSPPVPPKPIEITIPEAPPREYIVPIGIVTSPTSPVTHRPPEIPLPPFPEPPKREHLIPMTREFSPYENVSSQRSKSPRPVSERTAFHSQLEALVGKQAKEQKANGNGNGKEHFVTITKEETKTEEKTTTEETTETSVPVSTFIPEEYRLPKEESVTRITDTVKEMKIPVVTNLPSKREDLLKAFNEKLNELKELSKTVFQRSCSVEPTSTPILPENHNNRFTRNQSVDRNDPIAMINKDFEQFLQSQPARKFLSCQNLGESLEKEEQNLNGSSENIARPIMKEVQICEQRKAGKIRAPRLSADFGPSYASHIQQGRLPTYMPRHHSCIDISKTSTSTDTPDFSLYPQTKGKLPTYMSRPHSTHSTTSFQGLKQKYHAPIAEDPLMNQHMAEEWLDKIAEREERRLQKIIKISQLKNEAKSNRKTVFEENTNIGEEFLKKAKERRRRFCMQSDSDRESGTDARGSETDEPSVKITDEKLKKTRHLPQHLRDFVQITKEFKKEETTGDSSVQDFEKSSTFTENRLHQQNPHPRTSAFVKPNEVRRYQYKSSGYQSEPEAGYHYDSDYYTMNNKPLDRRRTVWPPAKESQSNQRSLLEQGYESDTNLIFHKKEIEENDLDKYLNDYEKRQSYKRMQSGGEPPLLGFRKPAPEKPKVSPSRYIETDVNIHYKSPVRFECKEVISEEELAQRQAEHMKRIYEQEKYEKYIRQLQDINSRRHTDHFMSSQKSPIPLNRYDDFNSEYICIKSPNLIPPNTICKALYDFKGQSFRELSFKKGDYIIIRRQIDNNWFEGEHNARVGLLPIKYVEVMTRDLVRRPKTPSEGQARAKYNFNAQSEVELSLNKGELVTLTRRVDSNWFEGKIANRKGIFPVNYVEVLTDIGAEDKLTKSIAEYSASVSATARNNFNNNNNVIPIDSIKETKTVSHSKVLHVDTDNEPVLYRALYKYRPQNNDELELKEGDLIFVLEICDDGWYVGTSQRTGCFGTFPGNYVQIVRD